MESFLITFLCSQLALNYGSQYNNACTSAINSTFITTGVHDELSLIQHDVEKIGNQTKDAVEDKTGSTWKFIFAGYVIDNYVRTGTFQVSTPIKPIANNLSLNINSNSGNLSLTWQF
jgi:hypothetical protein